MGSKAKQQAPAPLPENWPAHIAYLTAPRYSPGLTPTHFAGIRAPPDPSDPLPEIPRHLKPGPCPAVRIAPITDPNRMHQVPTYVVDANPPKQKKCS